MKPRHMGYYTAMFYKILFILLLSIGAGCIPHVLFAQEKSATADTKEPAWTWTDREGKRRTREELDEILRKHGPAVIEQISRGRADLSGARLWDVNLSGAFLNSVNLRGASLRRTDLSSASLQDADLSFADLRSAELKGANLTNAKVTGVIFEPKSLPNSGGMAYARGLSRMKWKTHPKAMNALRKAFREDGYATAERQVIAAFRRHDAALWETVLFDWTSEFGANASRPLMLVVVLWFLSSAAYYVGLRRGRSGLYLLASGKPVNTGNERLRILCLRYHPPRHSHLEWYRRLSLRARREARAFATASLFSLMSTFNIGFREFNFGRWIRMMQPREFDIKARGWPRAVSGVQALLSVGLLAMSILSYLGRPFAV